MPIKKCKKDEIPPDLLPYLESLDRRLKYVRYHCQEAEIRLRKEYPNSHAILKNIVDIHQKAPNAGDNLLQTNLEAEAHLIAALHSLHTLPDILAHFIYYGLDSIGQAPVTEKGKTLREKDISAPIILKHIEPKNDLLKIHPDLNELINHDDALHLDAIVNQSKHRQIVRITPNLGRQINFTIQSIDYGGQKWSATCAYSFIQEEHTRRQALGVSIVNEICRIIEKHKVAKP